MSRRYLKDRATLVKTYNSRAQSNRNCRYFDHQILNVYNNKIRVSVDEETGKVPRDEETNKISGVIIKLKEKDKTIDDIKNHARCALDEPGDFTRGQKEAL